MGKIIMYYSQCEEDVFIDNYFSKKKITYLDVGAGNPKEHSNTYYFYENGSNGVLIEADPEKCVKIKKERPLDVLLEKAVVMSSEKKDFVELFVMSASTLNTIKANEAENMIKIKRWGNQKIEKKIKVETTTINEVFLNNFNNNKCDFMSVDLEGLDLDVLKDLNINVYRPKLICVETKGGHISFTKDECDDFMTKNNYISVFESELNTIYEDKNEAGI